MKKYYLGSKPYITATIKNRSGSLTDPDTSATVQIEGEQGKIFQAYTAMTKTSTGLYYYNGLTLTSGTHPPGKYYARVKVTDTSDITIDEVEFEVMGR